MRKEESVYGRSKGKRKRVGHRRAQSWSCFEKISLKKRWENLYHLYEVRERILSPLTVRRKCCGAIERKERRREGQW